MHIKGKGMKTYVFRVVIEPDEDRWFASCPALRQYAATTWGYTREEALQHIREVVQMVVEELIEDGEPIPEDVQVSQGHRQGFWSKTHRCVVQTCCRTL